MFLFLQEHWLSHHEAHQTLKRDFPKLNFVTTSSDMFIDAEDLALRSGPTWHGAAIGWPIEVNCYISKLPIVSDRFCGVLYHNDITDISLLSYSVYLPTSGQDEYFLEVIDALHKDITCHFKEKFAIIIGADTNQSLKSTPRRTEAMKWFLTELSLKPILTNNEPTFHHNNLTSESQIDNIFYFIPNQMLVKMKMKDHLCQKHESQNLSCHDVITAEIDLVNKVAAKNEPDYSTTYKEFRVKKPKWNISGAESYQKQTARILTELLDRFKKLENIPVLTEMFSRMLVLSAEQNFETSNPTPNRVKQK